MEKKQKAILLLGSVLSGSVALGNVENHNPKTNIELSLEQNELVVKSIKRLDKEGLIHTNEKGETVIDSTLIEKLRFEGILSDKDEVEATFTPIEF